MRRGQLSLSLVEAGVGVLLVFAVAAGFLLGPPPADATERRLDGVARDVGTLLASEGVDGNSLAAVVRSDSSLDARRSAVTARVDALLPDGLRAHVQTPSGTVGPPAPGGRPVGVARVSTASGPVVVRVWYA